MTKSDLISREDAIAAFPKITLADIGFATKAEYRAEAIENINALPSAEAVQGEWIYKTNDESLCDEWECGKCGNWTFVKTNFCPHCGARMTKGGDDQ